MTGLRIADGLVLPLDWMVMATVVYGARGSGKTTLGRVVAEELWRAGQRFVAVDLKGDWYGLKSTADGSGAGIPVVIFGGEHADLPLADGSGQLVGEIIATHDQSFVVDLEHMSKGRQVRWLKDFFLALYHHNRRPLMVLADEIQRYAPQRPMSPDETICLGAVEDVVKLGRKHGLGILALTQRGAGLNKEVSELCDVLVALRTPGPLDQDRIKDWLDANTTREQRDQVMGRLAKLPTGTAIVASGHPEIDLFMTTAIRRSETFDSSATPKVGQQVVTPRVLADVDLEAIRARLGTQGDSQHAAPAEASTSTVTARERYALTESLRIARVQLAEVIQERDALRATERKLVENLELYAAIARSVRTDAEKLELALTRKAGEIRSALAPPASDVDAHHDVMLLTDEAPTLPVDVSEGAETRNGSGAPPGPSPAGVSVTQVGDGGSPAPSPTAPSSPPSRRRGGTVPSVAPPPSQPPEAPAVSAVERRVLDALATLDAFGQRAPSRAAVAGISGYRQSGTWNSAVSRLERSGRLAFPSPGALALTDAGRALARSREIRTLAELHEVWRSTLSPLQRKLFAAVIDVHPGSIDRTALAERVGYQQSGTFNSALSYLRTIGAVVYPKGDFVAASPLLFPAGLTS